MTIPGVAIEAYVSVAKKWNWLHKEFIFALLTKDRRQWVKKYRQFVSVDNDEEIAGVLESRRWPSALGPERFIGSVKGKYYAVKADQDVPQARELAPAADLIIDLVCEFYNVSRDEIYRSRRGEFNEPRNVAIFLTRKLRSDGLQEIGRQFGMEKYSFISSIIERMKKQMLKDRNLKRRMDRVAERIIKTQEQVPFSSPLS